MLDFPGCYSSATTEAEALAQAPARMAAYLERLARHDSTLPTPTDVEEAAVVERFEAFPCAADPDYLVNAFFEDDRRALGYADIALALRLLDWNREELLALVGQLSATALSQPLAGDGLESIAGILRHIAGAENWCFEQLDLGLSRLPGLPIGRLEAVRGNTKVQLPQLIGVERVTVNCDEQWSARKVLRRTLWHEQDHTQHIAQLLGQRAK
jgi:predicted RNase H-like HicB family nuclease